MNIVMFIFGCIAGFTIGALAATVARLNDEIKKDRW